MHIAKRCLALCLALIVLMMTTALAEVPFLMHSNGWSLEGTPVEVLLKADVDTHMPFSDERLAMLTPITELLSLRLVTGQDEGSVTIAIADTDTLSLQYRGNAVQLSCLPDMTFTAQADPMSVLLGTDVSAEGGYELLGLAREGETLLTDSVTLLEKIPAAFDKYGKRSTCTNTISGYGIAAYRYDYTVAASNAAGMKETLLSICPDGWLKEILSDITFTGKQALRIYYTAEDAILRVEYNGACGPKDNQRTVKLVYKQMDDGVTDKDYIELTSPAQRGKNKNNLTFERMIGANKKGEKIIQGNYNYTVSVDGVTSIRKGSFALKNAYTGQADVISGTATFESKLNGAEKYDAITLAPNLTISGTMDAPIVSGTLMVTEEYAGKVTEKATVSIEMEKAELLTWSDRPNTVDLSSLDNISLATVQEEVAASVATALIRPLIVMMGAEGEWFFRDLPEDAIQSIIDAAGAAQ